MVLCYGNPKKLHTKLKKPDSKGIYMIFWKKQNYRDGEQICDARDWKQDEGLTTETWENFECDRNILDLDCDERCTTACVPQSYTA